MDVASATKTLGDYLSREDKLEKLYEARSISGFNDWQEIMPDGHHDWINQRNEAFANFYPLGTPNTRAGKADEAIFKSYSLGLSTGRDVYIHNFSRDVCAENARKMTQNYLAALSDIEENPKLTAEEAARAPTHRILSGTGNLGRN